MYTIDTSIFINAVEPHAQDHGASRQLLGLLRARQIPVIVPALVTVEVSGTVSRLRGADAVYAAVSQQFATTLISRDREHLG